MAYFGQYHAVWSGSGKSIVGDLIAEVERLRTALDKYACHLHACDLIVYGPGKKCSCGLDEILESTQSGAIARMVARSQKMGLP